MEIKPAFLKRPTVQCRVGIKKSQLYELIKVGKAPAPIHLSTRSVAWISEEVEEWIDLLKQNKTWLDREVQS